MRRSTFAAVMILLTAACASQPQVDSPPVAARKPSQAEDASPPMATPVRTRVYSWTSRPEAERDPVGFVRSNVRRGAECVARIKASPNAQVPGCEGNEMAAGPGLYTCDNPFTSHDYGSIVIAIPTRDTDSIALATGRYTPPPASDGLDRAIYGNPAYSGIIYDFRYSGLNSRALVIRGEAPIEVDKASAVKVQPSSYTILAKHQPFRCEPTTGFSEVVAHWGDHFELLALTFNSSLDPENQDFVSGNMPNAAGLAAAVASDAVAAPDSAVNQKVQDLKKLSQSLGESVGSSECRETESYSPRACVARRVFDSLIGNEGTPRNPTYAWEINDLKKALVTLKVASRDGIAKARTREELLAIMTAAYKSAAPAILQARNCAVAIRKHVELGHFGTWGEDPN